jgi:beta-xylosidase
LGGSIDPSPFVGSDGSPYLVWKSNGGGGASAIWSQQLDATGTALVAGSAPVQLLVADQSWEGGVVEAPNLVTSGGRYFLFYSGNSWKTADYATGVAMCAGPLGPCSKPLSGPILSSESNLKGPGGASVFTDVAGTAWIAFHAWSPGAVGFPNNRSLYLRRLSLSGSTPVLLPA